MASHRGGGSNRRRRQMCPGTCALPALEVPVRRGRTALPCTHHIGVHPQTHGTPCITPLRTGRREDHVQRSSANSPQRSPSSASRSCSIVTMRPTGSRLRGDSLKIPATHLATPRQRKRPPLSQWERASELLLRSSGGRISTCDLRVMSTTNHVPDDSSPLP